MFFLQASHAQTYLVKGIRTFARLDAVPEHDVGLQVFSGVTRGLHLLCYLPAAVVACKDGEADKMGTKSVELQLGVNPLLAVS